MEILAQMLFPTRTKWQIPIFLFLIIFTFNFLTVHLWPIRDYQQLKMPYFNLNMVQGKSNLSQPQTLPIIQTLPHCSKAIVTVSHSSRLTRRSAKLMAIPQMSLNIGIGQTICFRLQEDPLLDIDDSRKTKTKFSKTGENNETKPELLHTLTLTELEQYHAITERYRFAIPEVETNCICECNPQASTCQADEYKYGKCETPQNFENLTNSRIAACHRTFFPNQPVGSCGAKSTEVKNLNTSPTSRLCCQVRFQAFQNRRFTAVRLKASTTYAVLRYSVYGWLSPENKNNSMTNLTKKWIEYEKRRIRVQLDGSVHNSVLDEISGLKLSIVGLSNAKSGAENQLEPGMYFVEEFPNGEYGQLTSQALNRITEHDFHKLGWFRLPENNIPFVQSGDIFLDKIHHARAENCAQQLFKSVLEASYYINKNQNESTQFQLAESLSRTNAWIRSAHLFDSSARQAIVTVASGTSLSVTLTIPSSVPKQSNSIFGNDEVPSRSLAFVHNSSRIADFSATILVNRFSDSLLNLTVVDAQGVLNGYIRELSDWSGTDIDSFSVTIPPIQIDDSINQNLFSENENKIIGSKQKEFQLINLITPIKPYPSNSVQIVCLRPDDADQSQEICRPVQSIQIDLEINTIRNEWANGIGNCAECNQFSVEGFMKFLNPANWTKGVTSLSDALMLLSDIFGYIFVIIVLYIILAKILIPLIGCCFCPMSIFYSRSKK